VLSLALGLLAAASSATPSAPADPDDTLARVKARGELVWGGDVQGGEPYVYEDPKDPKHLIGFEVDIADALGRRLGVRVRFAQAEWSNLVPTLERGDFDVIMNGLEDTPERRDRILLSKPYFVFGETLAVRRGQKQHSLDELHGHRVATLNQSYAYEFLAKFPVERVLYEGVSEPYTDLELGRVDGVLLDHIIANRYGCVRKDVECVAGDVTRGTYVVGIRKDDRRLQRAIDDALDGMVSSGELRRILEHWALWDARQDALAKAVPAPSAAPESDVSSKTRAPDSSTTVLGPEPERHFGLADAALFLSGALITVALSVSAFAIALPLGLLLALGRLGRSNVARWLASAYVEVFRGTPLLLQLYVLYFALAPVVKLGPMTAAILGLAFNYASYEAEIQRGALLAVPRGQAEAARALGMSRWQALRHVLLPQSMRIALPSMTNDFVALLKDSSLVSVITVVELTKRMTIAAVDLRGWLVPGIACAALYFAMSYPLARLAVRLEERLKRDQHPETR
jgi:polar amino acid transport system substrate-binding protein